MRFATIEKLKFKLSGRAVPAVRVSNVDYEGKINTIHLLGNVKENANSLVNTWDEKAWQKDKKDGTMITLIDESGIARSAYIVSETGETISLYSKKVRPEGAPNAEDILGKIFMADVIAEGIDMGKSMRNLMLGAVIGAPIGYVLINLLLGIINKIVS